MEEIRVDALTREAAFLRCRAMLGEESRGRARVVVTPNLKMAAACHRDLCMGKLLAGADLCVPDGMGLLLAAKGRGERISQRVAGIDLGERILCHCSRKKYPVYFLGGKPGRAEQAAKRWKKQYPNLPVAGFCDGYFAPSEEGEVCRKIAASGAFVLFVCMGFPRQERWAMQHRGELGFVRLCLCLGGALDVWSGYTKRAPKVFQRFGMEWFWRMACQPRRFADLPAMVAYLIFAAGRTEKEENGKNNAQK